MEEEIEEIVSLGNQAMEDNEKEKWTVRIKNRKKARRIERKDKHKRG